MFIFIKKFNYKLNNYDFILSLILSIIFINNYIIIIISLIDFDNKIKESIIILIFN